jgi:hypothetical protein
MKREFGALSSLVFLTDIKVATQYEMVNGIFLFQKKGGASTMKNEVT